MLRVAESEGGLWRPQIRAVSAKQSESSVLGHGYVQRQSLRQSLKALTHREAVVRAQAAHLALKKMKSGAALQSALQDPDTGVVLQVMRALEIEKCST